jgi:hypothetical protein
MKERILPYIILITAIIVSISSGYYSVYGISKLFAGASIEVMIMAGSLEISKLVIATMLHTYWNKLKILLKIYFTSALIILIIITSAGVYGFLSNAYQKTSDEYNIIQRNVELYNSKQSIFNELKNESSLEKNNILKSINELRQSISNPGQVQYVDNKTGNIITSTSNNKQLRESLEKQLTDAMQRRDLLSDNIQIYTDSINKYEILKIELLNTSDAASELGPLKYISNLTNKPIDGVVNYFILLIIIVFDPLAILLIISANFAFKLSKKEKQDHDHDYDDVNITENYNEEHITVNDNNKIENNLENIDDTREINIENSVNNNEVSEIDKMNFIEKRMNMIKENRKQNNKSELNQLTQKISSLTPDQIRNMSHQDIKNLLKRK